MMDPASEAFWGIAGQITEGEVEGQTHRKFFFFCFGGHMHMSYFLATGTPVFQSQSGFCLICFFSRCKCNVHSLRSGATPANFLTTGIAAGHFPTCLSRWDLAWIRTGNHPDRQQTRYHCASDPAWTDRKLDKQKMGIINIKPGIYTGKEHIDRNSNIYILFYSIQAIVYSCLVSLWMQKIESKVVFVYCWIDGTLQIQMITGTKGLKVLLTDLKDSISDLCHKCQCTPVTFT